MGTEAAAGDLPSGQVTFVFTDIEGSTRLFRTLGDDYVEVLDAHRAVLRTVFADGGGVVVSTEGDAFFVAFGDVDDAVRACADAQRALAAASWPHGVDLRVRMGVHTGFARPHGRDYTALAVHQCARIVGAAHGGQVLLSEDVAAGAGPGAPVEDLGPHRVRDFDGPVRLHRLVPVGWPDVELPPRARPAAGHNITRPLTLLIGRERDTAAIVEQLAPGQLVSIVGPGGVGKTRLLVDLGLELAPRWADGAWLVDLSGVTAQEQVAAALAQAVGVPVPPGASPLDATLAHLEEAEALLLVDNCEHVVAAAAAAVASVLVACPGVGVLATSRTPLGLRAEHVHRLAPLSTDGDDAPAVRLLLDRAPDLGGGQLRVVRELCERLEGLPLALELAAARATSVPPEVILDQLSGGVEVLRSRDPSLPDRHRSMQDVLDWSWELLSDPVRDVLTRVAVLPDGFDLRLAAVAVGADVEDRSVATAVWELMDHSVAVADDAAGASRFRLPLPVREHALARLDHAARAAVVDRLGEHLVQRFGPRRAHTGGWSSELAAELGNVRAVARVLAGTGDDRGHVLAWAVGRLHELRGTYAVGAAELDAHLEALPATSSAGVAVLTLLTDLHLRMADLTAARRALARAEGVGAGSPAWDAVGLQRSRAMLALRAGDTDGAAARAEEALTEARTDRDLVRVHSVLGVVRGQQGRWSDALAAFEREVAAASVAGLDAVLAKAHGNTAECHLAMGQWAEAARHQVACLDLARATGEPVLVAFSLNVAARLLVELHARAEVVPGAGTAADLRGGQDGGLLGEGWLEDVAQAVRLHAASLLAQTAAGWVPYDVDRAASEAFLARAAGLLGDDACDRARREGEAWSVTEAAASAEVVLDAVSRTQA